MKPLSLTRAPHDDQIASTKVNDSILRPVTGAETWLSCLGDRTQNERSWSSDDDDGDESLIEPAQLPIAMQTLEVVPGSVPQRRDAIETNPVAGVEPPGERGHIRIVTGVETGAEALFGAVAVVSQHLTLSPVQTGCSFTGPPVRPHPPAPADLHEGVITQVETFWF